MSEIEIEIGVCALADYDEDGHPQIQTDAAGLDGKAGMQPGELLMPYGLHGLPLDPERGAGQNEVGLGAQCLIISIGDRRQIIPLQDPRDIAGGKIPKLRKGGTQLVGGAGAHRSFLNIEGEDPKGSAVPGSITLVASYTKGGQKKSLGLTFNVREGGTEEITLVHGEGQSITMAADGSRGVVMANAKGDAWIETGDNGNVLAGATKVQGALAVGEEAARPLVNAAKAIEAFKVLERGVEILWETQAAMMGEQAFVAAAPGGPAAQAAAKAAAIAAATAQGKAAMATLRANTATLYAALPAHHLSST